MPQLLDIDHGRWQVTTEASIYILDLDERWLLRVPGAGPAAEGQVVAVNTLPHDHQPLPLLHVMQCEVGERMWLLSEPNPDGSIGRRVSTNVLDIRPAPGPSRRSSRRQPPDDHGTVHAHP